VSILAKLEGDPRFHDIVTKASRINAKLDDETATAEDLDELSRLALTLRRMIREG
jgi:hypothetical protein